VPRIFELTAATGAGFGRLQVENRLAANDGRLARSLVGTPRQARGRSLGMLAGRAVRAIDE
jgi:hypothetical protein